MTDVAEVPDRVIASALETAVGIAALGAKSRPPVPYPSGLKPFLKLQRLSGPALGEVRRVLVADDVYRRRLAKAVPDELLDEAGSLWLRRPDGWEQRLRDLVAAGEDTDPALLLRRAEKRREAAEQVARRAVADQLALRTEVDRVTGLLDTAIADLDKLRAERDELAGQVTNRANDLRRVREDLAAATERIAALDVAVANADRRALAAEQLRDDVLSQRANRPSSAADEAMVLAGANEVAAELAAQLAAVGALADGLQRAVGRLRALEPKQRPAASAGPDAAAADRGARPRRRRPAGRTPIGLPGGVYGNSAEAANHLVRQPGVVVLVDGYNVAKLGWPSFALEDQRELAIVAAEDVARRFGTEIHVIFDGADVEGAVSTGRRLVRVSFSPAGVLADDVLVAEVAALDDETPVVVVTNDQAVVAAVRAHGANTLSSEQWLEVAGR